MKAWERGYIIHVGFDLHIHVCKLVVATTNEIGAIDKHSSLHHMMHVTSLGEAPKGQDVYNLSLDRSVQSTFAVKKVLLLQV